MKYFYTFLVSIFAIIILSGCSEESKSGKEFDIDGMVKIDGIRTFIIGSYHHPKADNPFKELNDNGYNFVHVSPGLQPV